MAHIIGTAGADTLNGTSAADQIEGLGGDDELDGLEGADDIDGGTGNDEIRGGDGFDTLRGGAGDDHISDGRGGGLVFGGDGADLILFHFHYSLGNSLSLDGGNDNDTITVGNLTPGALTINGGAGSDRVSLVALADTAEISLGTSRDILGFLDGFFGPQVDNFLMSAITVTDFAAGNSGDVIDWDLFIGMSLLTWDQTANPFGAGFIRLVQSGTSTLVQLDFDGAGSDYGWGTFITLENVSRTALTAANFHGYDPNGANVAGGTFVGTDGPDEITGTMGADTFEAGDGDDWVYSGGGSDEIEGGAGRDTLWGEVGHDILRGEDGDDFLMAGVGNDRMNGGEGDDFLNGEEGDDFVTGGAGNDSLSGEQGDDVLIGGDGDDSLSDGEGSNQYDGGAGNDILYIVSLYGDTISALGGSGNDLLQIHAHNVVSLVADAGSGDDRVEVAGNGGPMTLRLGDGNDVLALTGIYSGFAGGITVADFKSGVWGEALDWTTFLEASLIAWNGTANPFDAGYLRLVQSGGSTLLQIDRDADDFNYGFQTIVTLQDVLASDLTIENIGYHLMPVKTGTAAANTIVGTSAAERIDGLAGNDSLVGQGGNDLLVGDVGHDILNGGAGRDRMYGGAGNDTFDVDHAGDRVFEREQEGLDLVRSLVTFTLPDHVENLTLGGAGAIGGTGNGLANVITGNAAANLLAGGDGNDSLNGGAGADEMRGGAGDDLFYVSAGDQVVEGVAKGTDTVRSSASYILGANVENLVLTGGADLAGTGNALANMITGNGGNNRLDGKAGADTMAGGAGHDVYVVDHAGDQAVEAGSSGNDTVESAVGYTLPVHFEKLVLTGGLAIDGRGNAGANTITGNSGGNFLSGGSGNDVIDGGAGSDQLMGGSGIDKLTGGVGHDRFYFNVAPGAANADRILDFSSADDAIHLLRSVFTRAGGGGTLAPSAFHQGSAASDAGDRILYDAATGNIFYDADGTGAAAALLFATVAAGTPLSQADFVIYG